MAVPVRDGDPTSEGEFLSIRERLVVATSWGRIDQEDFLEGNRVEAGTILGQLRENGRVMLLAAPMPAVFVRWLVRAGERVAPGSPLAVLLSVDGED
jgi:multidrug efflux pump subunit AcrA (membrane-fusion protein)